jgi:hypothetical protein
MPYTIQGQQANIETEPETRQGETYVPLREVVQALGGSINWDNTNKVAQATIGQWVATVNLADMNVDVSGTAVTLSNAPFVDDDGMMWVPASFFQSAYGYQVQASGNNVSITNPNG